MIKILLVFLFGVHPLSWATDLTQNIQKSHDRGRNEQQYFFDMDASFLTKWGVIFPAIEDYRREHPLHTIYDIGTGTGLLAATLADFLYSSDVSVIGTDVMPDYVMRASERFLRNNLRFKIGSTDEPCVDIDKEPLANILVFSSVLHEAYSYGNDGDSIDALKQALQNAHKSLTSQGRVIIRDFVAPEEAVQDQTIILHHRRDDIKMTTLHGAQLELSCDNFANHFRAIKNKAESTRKDIRCDEIDLCPAGFRCYQTNMATAYEFIYRKDFYDSYEAELNERYGFITSSRARELLEDSGFRILSFATFKNPWIQLNRIDDNITLFTPSYEAIAVPDYQMFVVAEARK